MLFRSQEGMIFGLHWLCEKMLFEFASVIPYVAQLREDLLRFKVGETHVQVSSLTALYLPLGLLTEKSTEIQNCLC